MQVKPSYICVVMLAIGLLLPYSVEARGTFTVSLDDNYLNQYTYAVPILEAKGVKATFYIVTNRIGSPGYMTLAQIQSLRDRGFDVAPHTKNHVDLSVMTSARDRVDEIFGSRYALELQLFKTYTFAPPFGAYSAAVLEDIKRAGFLAARGTDKDLNYRTTNPFRLNSHSWKSTTTFAEIQSMLDQAFTQDAWYGGHIHQIGGSGTYNINPPLLDQTISYAQSRGIQVVTIKTAACNFFYNGC